MANRIGPLVIDLKGEELTEEECELLQHPLVGGVILFTRNFTDPEQIRSLCQKIRAARTAPLLIMVDHEGGRVQRFRSGFTLLPSMGTLGQWYDQSPEKALDLASMCGTLMAQELLAVGIDLSLAPVLDLHKKENPAILDRAFHRDPSIVSALAKTLVESMHKSGMAAVGKHFPGHGSVTLDSHVTTPEDSRTLNDILQDDLQPFIALINAGIDAIMPAHIIFRQIDELPVGFSKQWLQTILREQYLFSGMILSDDLNMNGASTMGDPVTRAKNALAAGCEMLLMCNNRKAVIEILDHLPIHDGVNQQKFKLLQGKFSISFESLQKTNEWRTKSTSIKHMMEKLPWN